MANKPEYIILHHSAGKDYLLSDFAAIKKFHVEVRGWSDIGYHLVLEMANCEAIVTKGRPYSKSGAHCPGKNTKSIGICTVGNFELETMDARVKARLIEVIRGVAELYGIPADHVLGHNEAALPGHGTACPGRYFPIEEIRQALKA